MLRHDIDKKRSDIDMQLTISQAAELSATPSERTLNRHRKSGKLSMDKDESGKWMIDAAELSRVYKITVDEIETALERHRHGNDNSDTTPRHDIDSPTTKNDNEVIELRAEVKLLAERNADKDKEISKLERTAQHLETRYDKLLDTLEKKDNLLLTYTQKPEEPPQQAPKKQNTGLKAIMAVLVLVVIAGAALYGWNAVNGSTGLKIGNNGATVQTETPQQ